MLFNKTISWKYLVPPACILILVCFVWIQNEEGTQSIFPAKKLIPVPYVAKKVQPQWPTLNQETAMGDLNLTVRAQKTTSVTDNLKKTVVPTPREAPAHKNVLANRERKQSDLKVVTNKLRFDGKVNVKSVTDHPQAVIDCLTNGRWERNNSVTEEEYAFMRKYIRHARTTNIAMLNPFQRKDGLCGNLTFPGKPWHRAVCDPEYSTPCCYKGTCRNMTVEECSCDDCYDLRQELFAELSTWVNDNANCEVRDIGRQEACDILDGTHLVMIGDSHMRQTYMAVATLLTEMVEDYLLDTAPKDMKARCHGFMMYYGKNCSLQFKRDMFTCGGRMTLSFKELPSTRSAKAIIQLVSTMRNKTGSVVLISIGHHDSFNIQSIISNITTPVLDTIEKSGSVWPKVIWIGGHSMGIMKTPTKPTQTNKHIKVFNRAMREFVTKRGVVFLDMFNVTRNLVSGDGSHYYNGANEQKARLIVNFLDRIGNVSLIPDYASKLQLNPIQAFRSGETPHLTPTPQTSS